MKAEINACSTLAMCLYAEHENLWSEMNSEQLFFLLSTSMSCDDKQNIRKWCRIFSSELLAIKFPFEVILSCRGLKTHSDLNAWNLF